MSRKAALLIPGVFALIAALTVAAIVWPDISNGVLVAALIAALGGVVIGGSLGTSLRRITEGTRRFASGELTPTLDTPHGAITNELTNALNDMATKLEARFQDARQEQSRLIAALDSIIDAVIAVDAEDRISYANLAAEGLFMRPRHELVGNSLTWVMPNDELIAAVRESRREGRSEVELVDRPSKRQLQVITTPIIGVRDWAALAVFRDLTEIRRIEQVRRDFVANVSHELRTPLASIKAVIETLQSGALDDRPVAEDFLSRADVEVDRLAQMVEELLELSRIESGDVPLAREAVDMIAVVSHAVIRLRAQAEKQEIRLEVEDEPVIPAITGDAQRLERAVLNLVHNAIKFTPRGGTVTVRVRSDDAHVAVSVTDTGTGIDPADIPRVFERFYKADQSRHGGGTGLGLAVVKHTVEAHGGNVTVESQPGKGSTFTFAVPVTR